MFVSCGLLLTPLAGHVTHPQCSQLPHTGRDQSDSLNGRVHNSPGVRLLALVSELSFALTLVLLLLANVLEAVIQVPHPSCQVGDMGAISMPGIGLGLSNDDVQVKSDLRLSGFCMGCVRIRRNRSKTDLVVTSRMTGESEFALAGSHRIDHGPTSMLLEYDHLDVDVILDDELGAGRRPCLCHVVADDNCVRRKLLNEAFHIAGGCVVVEL